jgi:hypothetical protein
VGLYVAQFRAAATSCSRCNACGCCLIPVAKSPHLYMYCSFFRRRSKLRFGHSRHRCSPSAGPFGNTTPSMARQPSPVIHDRSFGRFDEILYLVEKASVLTLAQHRRIKGVTLTATLPHRASAAAQSIPPCIAVRCMYLTLTDFVRCHILVASCAQIALRRQLAP